MRSLLRFLFFLLLASNAFAQQDLPIRDEGALAGRAREINCVGAGITCSVSGGIAAFTFGTFAAGETLTFNTAFAPITITGGDSGAGDPALIIDDPTDGYIAIKFPNYVEFLLDGGADIIASGSVSLGTAGASLFVDQTNLRTTASPELQVNNTLRVVSSTGDALLKVQPSTRTSSTSLSRLFQIESALAATGGAASDEYGSLYITQTFGAGGVAQNGIGEAAALNIIVEGSGDSGNQWAALFSSVRADIGTGYTQSTGPVGELWGFDLGVHGPIAVQPDSMNGITQVVNNYYNGSPADAQSGAAWLITQPGTVGAGIDATHAAATTYPVDVGLGVIGNSSSSGVGFTTAIQIGGAGGPWGVTSSKIGTGIDIRDYTTRGIYVHNPSGTPTADIEITGKGIFPDARITKIGNLTSNGCIQTSGSDGTLSITSCGGGGTLDGARAYNSSGVSITANTWTTISLNSERFDNGGLHSTSSNTSRITIGTTGVYIISGSVYWSYGDSSTHPKMRILLNGSTPLCGSFSFSDFSTDGGLSCATVYQLTAGDYVELQGWVNSNAHNVDASGNQSPELAVQLIQ